MLGNQVIVNLYNGVHFKSQMHTHIRTYKHKHTHKYDLYYNQCKKDL